MTIAVDYLSWYNLFSFAAMQSQKPDGLVPLDCGQGQAV